MKAIKILTITIMKMTKIWMTTTIKTTIIAVIKMKAMDNMVPAPTTITIIRSVRFQAALTT